MKQQEIKHLKFLALLSSVRWYNILLIAMAQYMSAVFVFNDSFPTSLLIVAGDLKLHLLVVCTLLVVAGGFLINDFYDFKHDMIVRPKITLFQQYISKDHRIRLYVWFNLLAFVLAVIGSFEILLYFLVLAFGLWFYSHKLKNYPLVREISASLLTVSCFFSVGLHYFFIDLDVLAFGVYFTMLLFTRAIVKGYEEIKGDLAVNRTSISGILGDRKTRWVIRISILIQLLFSVAILTYFKPANWLYYIFFSNIILLGVFISLNKIRQGEFYLVNFIYKVLIVLGIVNLAFF